MSFDKDYPNRKDRRPPYGDVRDADKQCRHQGGCAYCEMNRKHFISRQTPLATETNRRDEGLRKF